MNKVIPLTKNHKDHDDVPDGLKWAIPIHECLETHEVKLKVQTAFRRKNIKIVSLEFDGK